MAAGTTLLRLDPLDQEQALSEVESRHRQVSLDHARATTGHPITVRQQVERIAAAEAAVVQVRARLLAQLIEQGLDPDVDAVMSTHRSGTSVALDIAIAEVRAAVADHRGQLAQRAALDLATFEHRRAQAELDLLAYQITAARQRLARMTITAPASGVVLTEDLHRLSGSRVELGGQLLEIADTSSWHAMILVPEADVHRIALGDSVRVDIEAFRRDEGAEIDGVVAEIAPQAAISNSVAYRVKVALDESQLATLGRNRLRKGYSVDGKIITRSGNAFRVLVGYLRETLRR